MPSRYHGVPAWELPNPMAPFVQPDSSEAKLQVLANLIAEVRLVQSSLQGSGLPEEGDAPFLFRQLREAVRSLKESAGEFVGDEDEKKEPESRGLLGRLFKGGAAKEEPENIVPPKDDNVEGFQGTAATIPVPELIGFLANTRKSGVLWVYAAKETFMVEFRDGSLHHATTDRPPVGERLGEVLVRSGAITEEEVDRFLNTDPSPGMLGAKLLRAYLITDQALRDALSTQVQNLFCRLLSESEAIFLFKSGMRLQIDQPLSVNVTHLLLESARMSDERGYAELRSSLGDAAEEAMDDVLVEDAEESHVEAADAEADQDDATDEVEASEVDGDEAEEADEAPLKKSA